jgi:hypothetical protein
MTKRNGKSFTIRDAVIPFGEVRAAVAHLCMYGVWGKKYPYLVLIP